MKKALLILVILTLSSCHYKVSYFDLKNDNETYYKGSEPFTGEAIEGETSNPVTIYSFSQGRKTSEIQYYSNVPNGKIKYEEKYSIGYLQQRKEYTKDGLLLEKKELVWDDSKKSVTAYIESFDWCGKMSRRRAVECLYENGMFKVTKVVYDQSIKACN